MSLCNAIWQQAAAYRLSVDCTIDSATDNVVDSMTDTNFDLEIGSSLKNQSIEVGLGLALTWQTNVTLLLS